MNKRVSVSAYLVFGLLAAAAIDCVGQIRPAGGMGPPRGLPPPGANPQQRLPPRVPNPRPRVDETRPAQPGLPAGLEKRSYRFAPTGEKLEYVVFVPGKVSKKKPAPLVIALHGATVPAATIMINLTESARKLGYIIAAPTGYNLTGWYGARRPGASEEFVRTTELSEQDVMNVLAIMRREYNIDERRIYLVGHSMGGAGVIHLGSKYPQIWAAAAALAPAVLEDPTDDFGNMRQTPLLIIQGDADPILPIDGTRRMVARIRESGVPVEYYEIKGGGHEAPAAQGAAVFRFFELHKPDGGNPL